MNTFTETQHFRQWWVWVFMGFSVLIFVGSLLSVGAYENSIGWLGTIPMLLIVWLMYIWRLDTRLDSDSVHYRIYPLLRWRMIPWNTIRSVCVVEYGFVGYGIRWGSEGWIYNVAGNKGLRVVFLDNRKITIGTQRPDELQTFLTTHPTLTTT